MKTNVFVLGTEYHFLLALSIIEEYFSDQSFHNKLIFLGKRLNQIAVEKLPANISTVPLFFDEEPDFKGKVHGQILNEEITNLFVVNAYRAPETYILSCVPGSTRRHLMQDGALFYNRIEKSVYKNRIKEMFRIYMGLWKKGIFFHDLILYSRFMERSGYIDELWMTNPAEYIGPKTKKTINQVHILPTPSSIDRFFTYFENTNSKFDSLSDCLIYLSVIIRNVDFIPNEIEQIKAIQAKTGKKNILIKLHPNCSDLQVKTLRNAFGDAVIKNGIPAELYIAKASDSYVVGCASTSLFYNNPECTYYAMKKFYQELGIYSKWYNINLPPHVKQVESLEEIV